jgi:hypothetical protein
LGILIENLFPTVSETGKYEVKTPTDSVGLSLNPDYLLGFEDGYLLTMSLLGPSLVGREKILL